MTHVDQLCLVPKAHGACIFPELDLESIARSGRPSFGLVTLVMAEKVSVVPLQ